MTNPDGATGKRCPECGADITDRLMHTCCGHEDAPAPDSPTGEEERKKLRTCRHGVPITGVCDICSSYPAAPAVEPRVEEAEVAFALKLLEETIDGKDRKIGWSSAHAILSHITALRETVEKEKERADHNFKGLKTICISRDEYIAKCASMERVWETVEPLRFHQVTIRETIKPMWLRRILREILNAANDHHSALAGTEEPE